MTWTLSQRGQIFSSFGNPCVHSQDLLHDGRPDYLGGSIFQRSAETSSGILTAILSVNRVFSDEGPDVLT
jgi:hypothetical protein